MKTYLILMLGGSQQRQCHGIKHVLVVPVLPFSVLIEIDLELGEFGNDDPGRLFLAGPAVAADVLFDRVGSKAQDFETLRIPRV